MKNIFILTIILIVIISQTINAQPSQFYFDVFITKSNYNDSSQVDFFCCVPNKTLKFNKDGSKYIAKYSVSINFTDSLNNKITNLNQKGIQNANSFEESQGSKGEFVLISQSTNLSVGNYKLRVILKDEISNKEYISTRTVSVINYNAFDFALSSIILLSNIEEVSSNYTITPYLSDNIYSLNDGYFVFFEVYNDTERKDINITTEITNNDNYKIIYANTIIKNADTGVSQLYIKIPADIKYGLGTNTLRIFATEGVISAASVIDSDVKILAAASRSIRSVSNISDRIIKNIETAIRQLRYVANSNQIDSMNKAETNADKMKLFEAFWKRLDPTPYTEHNEAMEEYYNRIDYANENFKAYKEGWLTDKGQVYVVFGSPLSTDRTNTSMADNRTYERWIYPNNRIIVFIDVSGFGDFRLYSPSIISDKYEYGF